MKKSSKIIILVAAILAFFVASSAVAWYAKNDRLNPNLTKGTVVTQYFHTGTGTELDPFIITRPVHYYNLIELYQRKSDFASADYYFQLGYDLDNDGDLEVYNYGDDGIQIKTGTLYSDSLNLACYSGADALLPIGTSAVPFNGGFDGSGLSIVNLSVKASETIGSTTYGTADVGIWGYVGADADIHDVYFDNVSIDLTDTDANATSAGHSLTHAGTVNVGYIAGHVYNTTKIDDVYVNNVTILGADPATCAYGYFGRIEQAGSAEVTTVGSAIATLRAAGDSAGFGGSIDIHDIFQRLQAIYNAADDTGYGYYVTAETILIDEVEKTQERYGSPSTRQVTQNHSERYYYYISYDKGGSFNFPDDNDTGESATYVYECLYGPSSVYTKNVTYYTLLKDYETGTYKVYEGVYIYDGTHYLRKTGTSTVGDGSSANKSLWVFDEDGHLFTQDVAAYVDDESNNYYDTGASKYYLTASNGSLSLVTTPGSATVWTHDRAEGEAVGSIYYVDGAGKTWYLIYDSGWKVNPFSSSSFTVRNGSAYLGASTSVSLNGTSTNYARWNFEDANEDGKGLLVGYINGQLRYLKATDGSLSLVTSSAAATDNWEMSLSGSTAVFTYTDSSSRVWYLCYDNGEWKCFPFIGSTKISNSTDYLGYNGSAFTSVGSAAALHFIFNSTAGSLMTVYNGSISYLNVSAGSLALSGSQTTVWHEEAVANSSNKRYYYVDGESVKWYIRFNGTNWDLFPANASYKIYNGSDYFGLSSGSFALTASGAAADWGTNSSGHIYTVVSGAIKYLTVNTSGTGSLTLGDTPTVWTYTTGGGEMYCTVGGETWYVYKQNSNWVVYPASTVYAISQGGQYLVSASNTTVGQVSNVNSASRWVVSGGQIYTYYGGDRRYLKSNEPGVSLVTSSGSPSTWTFANSVYSSNGWSLIYDSESGWTTYPSLSYFTIDDGTNYLKCSGGTLSNVSSSGSPTKWYADGTKIFCINGSSKYYLRGTASALSASTNGSESGYVYDFTYDGTNKRLSFTSGSGTRYVIYNGSNWIVSDSYEKPKTISTTVSGTTYYLNRNGTTGVTTTSSSSDVTEWTYDPSTNKIYTTVSGTPYYLRGVLDSRETTGMTNLGLTTSSTATGTTWTYSGNTLTCSIPVTVGGSSTATTYTMVFYDGSFRLIDLARNYYTVKFYNSSNYMSTNTNSTPTAASQTTAANATLWTFSNDSNTSSTSASWTSSQIYTTVNGTRYYLYNIPNSSNGSTSITFSTSTPSTTPSYAYYSSYSAYSIRISYYLNYYSSNWTGYNSQDQYAAMTLGKVTFSAANVMLAASDYITQETAGTTSVTTTRTSYSAATMYFTDTSSNTSHTLTSYTENYSHTYSEGSESTEVYAADDSIRLMTITSATGLQSGNPTYFPIRVDRTSSGAFPTGYPASDKNTGYIISGANVEDSGSGTNDTAKTWGDIRVSGYPISQIATSYSTSGLTVSRIGYTYSSTTHYLRVSKSGNNYVLGDTTTKSEANFWEISTSGGTIKTTVGGKTFYLALSGSTLSITESAYSSWSFNTGSSYIYNGSNYLKYNGSAWAASSGTAALVLTLGTLDYNAIYTADDSGIHTLTSDQKTDVFYQAALQLTQTLVESGTHVFGLHFMDASISMDHLVRANYVNVFGEEYYDYELPEDSIDFHVIERGTISFFAGDYFNNPNNDSFFSLHQVFRYTAADDEVVNGPKREHDIKYIKEIVAIYEHATSGNKVNFIYEFAGGTFSNVDGSYSGAVSLPTGYSSTPVFKTSWIKTPGFSSASTRLFFFEIPCNSGEYCLGSVSGHTGAYLVYLDIAANGGDALATAVSSDGSSFANFFKVDYRDAGDSSNHAVLVFSINAPDVTASDSYDFSVTVSFDRSDNGAPHQSGVYTITVVNKSPSAVTLSVLLCDEDNSMLTPFQYAYRVVYTNNDHTSSTIRTFMGYDYFQAYGVFSIPASGVASLSSYS
ncbi:MAG: hypothetical protein J5854_03230 [Clostridia bacterium]|nr:hypothetical protein [Clostridia bacterium]